MDAQKDAASKLATERARTAIRTLEGHINLATFVAIMVAPRQDEEALKLKGEAAIDAFKQGFGLLNEILGDAP